MLIQIGVGIIHGGFCLGFRKWIDWRFTVCFAVNLLFYDDDEYTNGAYAGNWKNNLAGREDES